MALWLASLLGLTQLSIPTSATAQEPDAPLPLAPLRSVAVPQPKNLGKFVRDGRAAVALGKALFWDMQLGSDAVQSCASCHFSAFADPRSKNQLNPATIAGDARFNLGGPNYRLSLSDFPLHKLADPDDRSSAVLRDSNDIVSSQGVFLFDFRGTEPGNPVDKGVRLADPVFSINDVNVRRVEPRHAPTVINSVFNFRVAWDGRAQHEFNGVNPWGHRDPGARVGRVTLTSTGSTHNFVRLTSNCSFSKGVAIPSRPLCLNNATLASQATLPPGNFFEMSHYGRTFPDIGRKSLPFREFGERLLTLQPLGRQVVSPNDSVLGPYANEQGNGLDVGYATLVKRAFKPEWWDTRQIVKLTTTGPKFVPPPTNRPLADDEYTLIEWNFSLFFGLAVQMYEATLVSGQTPVDAYLAGNTSALTAEEKLGLEVFEGKGGCINCHGGAELTNASVRNVKGQPLSTVRLADGGVATYDTGFFNVGVRPTGEDLGVGGTDVFGKPLSMTKLTGASGRHAVSGALKVPGLRNVALTPPYFHNGGQATLRQVIDFYNRGGDFRDQNSANVSADVRSLGLTEGEKDALVAFLGALTDERVRRQEAPFDHPQLFVPKGHPGDTNSVADDGEGQAVDTFIEIPAVGKGGGAPVPTFLDNFALGNPPPPDPEAAPEFAPPSLSFAARGVGTTSDPSAVQVTNAGAGKLIVSSISVKGTHAGDFPLASNTCVGAQLAEGASCTINVRFRPTAAGSRSAQLEVVTNAVESVRTVPLSGSGTTATRTASGPSAYSGRADTAAPVRAEAPRDGSAVGWVVGLALLAGLTVPFVTVERRAARLPTAGLPSRFPRRAVRRP